MKHKFISRPIILTTLLVCYAIALRLLYVWDGTFPFMYDHGRDALAVLEMVKLHSPALIGPRASIPGLYFGPAWYYLLSMVALINLHPMAPVVMMMGLLVVQLLLLKRFFGWQAALISATTFGWIWMSTSAWNPYPITFTSLIILIVFSQTARMKKISVLQVILLGLAASFGFHFSSAYAIFYPIIILAIIVRQKLRLQLTSWVVLIASFLLPFIPQLAFELRHDFLETRSVITYFQSGGSNDISFQKIPSVLTAVWGDMTGGTLPIGFSLPSQFALVLTLAIVFLCCALAWRHKNTLKQDTFLLDASLFIVIPTIGYFFLHFSPWYILGMLPAGTIIVAAIIKSTSKNTQLVIASLYIAASLTTAIMFIYTGRAELLMNKSMFKVKMDAIEFVRQVAAGRSFSSYQFAPDIYDYPYQYIYFYQASQGLELPVEFSYQPDVATYIPEKDGLLKVYDSHKSPSSEPEIIFFIVEKSDNSMYIRRWWGNQRKINFLGEKEISPELTVYWGTPKK